MFLDWSIVRCLVVITVFRVACRTSIVSVVGLLRQCVHTASINQSVIQAINGDLTFQVNVPSKHSF
jgi:hypothetical protein